MRKVSKKAMALLLATMMVGGAATACGGGSGDGGKDSANKTKINLTYRSAGLGGPWMDEVIAGFEAEYANKSYKDGKLGVYVNSSPSATSNNEYYENASKYQYHVIMTENPLSINKDANGVNFLDIDDIVRDETREGGSIHSDLFAQQRGIFQDNDGHYRILPAMEYYGSLNYNRDVFESCDALFAGEGCPDAYVVDFQSQYGPNGGYTVKFVSADGIGNGAVLSTGPDGVANTEDDGLPASLEEFLVLMDYLKNEKFCAPVGVAGDLPYYTNYFLSAMWSAFAGNDQMTAYYSLSGEIDVVTGFTDENLFEGIDYVKKPIVERKTIDAASGYLGQSMAAKYYAYAMLEIMHQEGFFNADVTASGVSHTGAQGYFINSSSSQAMNVLRTSKVAMLIEGSYWSNESEVNGVYTQYKAVANTTEAPDVRFMYLPNTVTTAEREADGFVAKKTSFNVTGMSVMALNAKFADDTEVIEAAKDFVRYFYKESTMQKIVELSGLFMPYSIDLSGVSNSMSLYTKSIYAQRDNVAGTNIAYRAFTEDVDALTKQTFNAAASYLDLTESRSSNYRILANGSRYYAITAYKRSDNTKNADGTFAWGSKNAFESGEITAAVWNSVFRIEQ